MDDNLSAPMSTMPGKALLDSCKSLPHPRNPRNPRNPR